MSRCPQILMKGCDKIHNWFTSLKIEHRDLDRTQIIMHKHTVPWFMEMDNTIHTLRDFTKEMTQWAAPLLKWKLVCSLKDRYRNHLAEVAKRSHEQSAQQAFLELIEDQKKEAEQKEIEAAKKAAKREKEAAKAAAKKAEEDKKRAEEEALKQQETEKARLAEEQEEKQRKQVILV